jgi:hypothetical protein
VPPVSYCIHGLVSKCNRVTFRNSNTQNPGQTTGRLRRYEPLTNLKRCPEDGPDTTGEGRASGPPRTNQLCPAWFIWSFLRRRLAFFGETRRPIFDVRASESREHETSSHNKRFARSRANLRHLGQICPRRRNRTADAKARGAAERPEAAVSPRSRYVEVGGSGGYGRTGTCGGRPPAAGQARGGAGGCR